MATEPKQFSEDEIEAVWQKAIVQPNNNPDEFRKDYAGAWICKNDYGKQTEYGWEIDHLCPLSLNGSHDISNLYPLQWQNNLEKSDNFPHWNTKMTSNGIHNVENSKSWFVNPNNYA